MSNPKIYITNKAILGTSNFNPRNYDPIFLFVKNELRHYPKLQTRLSDDITGGAPPPYWFFRREYEEGVPFIKTSAISRDFVNVNDLDFISPRIHRTFLKRSITRPYNVIYSMTGKFMGKAALCPPIIPELNMSQNSVVMKCKTIEESAFLCIYLNSLINRIQIGGVYSITKQKYINQGKIKELRVLAYQEEYRKAVQEYIKNITLYYESVKKIKETIQHFNQILGIQRKSFDIAIDFKLSHNKLEERILTPQYYRKDFYNQIKRFDNGTEVKKLRDYDINRGDEIGSDNYLFEGIPFIKTSDFLNFGVDYQPNYYCSEAIYSELEQDLQKGDILFTKDGVIGETAIIEESAKIVISSGILRIRPKSEKERYWLFLLLSSNWGKMFFTKWTVIASTMAHLRKDFIDEFRILKSNENLEKQFIETLRCEFLKKRDACKGVQISREALLKKFYEVIKI